jgi:APA family basic amino acid/polyamine antiporter
VPLIPILAVLACVWLMLSLSVEIWLRFLLAVYFAYGRRHSRFASRSAAETSTRSSSVQ